jgi:hypothetical protein
MRIWGFHHQQGGTDGTNTWDFRKPLAAFIIAVPHHELFFDPLNLPAKLRIFLPILCKQLTRERRDGLIRCNTFEKDFDPARTFCGSTHSTMIVLRPTSTRVLRRRSICREHFRSRAAVLSQARAKLSISQGWTSQSCPGSLRQPWSFPNAPFRRD